MDGDDIGLPKEVLLAGIGDACLLAFFRREILAPGDDFHPKGLGNPGGASAKFAEAQNAERQALEIESDCRLPGYPGLHSRVLVADAAGQFEHEADGDA